MILSILIHIALGIAFCRALYTERQREEALNLAACHG